MLAAHYCHFNLLSISWFIYLFIHLFNYLFIFYTFYPLTNTGDGSNSAISFETLAQRKSNGSAPKIASGKNIRRHFLFMFLSHSFWFIVLLFYFFFISQTLSHKHTHTHEHEHTLTHTHTHTHTVPQILPTDNVH